MHRSLPLPGLALHLLALAGVATAEKHYRCPPLGVSLPAPKAPGSSSAAAGALPLVQDWFANVTAEFEGTAVSLTVSSIHEDDPLIDLHHTPPKADDRGVSEVDAQTVYRVASISKVFTVLVALQSADIDMDDPVTKYVPELRELRDQQDEVNELTAIAWDDITVGSLADYMSGFGSESKWSEGRAELVILE